MAKTKYQLRHISSLSRAHLFIFIIIFAAIGGYIFLQSHAVGSTANVFVAANGSDSGTNCKRFASATTNPDSGGATLCASFQKAYQLAQGGDTVEVESGNYPFQSLSFDASKNSTQVVIQAAAGASVSFAGAQFGNDQTGLVSPDHLTLKNMTSSGSITFWGTSDFDQLINTNASFVDFLGGSNDLVKGGTFGPCTAPAMGACTVRLIGTNQTIDGATIHDMKSTDLVNYHVDGAFVRGCIGCAIKNSKFYNNMIVDIRIQNCCGLPNIQNLTIENNWFGQAWNDLGLTNVSHNLVDVNNEIPGLVIRFNSFTSACDSSGACGGFINGTDASNTLGTTVSPAQVYGNLLGQTSTSCPGNTNWQYNVFHPFSSTGSQSGCGPTDTAVPLASSFPYISQPAASGSIDYHINSASWTGSNFVPTTVNGGCPANDIDGDSRPQAAACDAGADEFVSGGAAKPGDLNGDGRVDIFDLSILLSNYGTSNPIADINRDGIVDIFDLSTLLSNYGS